MNRREHIRIAIRFKRSLVQSIDSLPYTEHFESVYTQFCEEAHERLDRNYVWRTLLAVRKSTRTTKPDSIPAEL